MLKKVNVVTEGATERWVGLRLYQRNILEQSASPELLSDHECSRREGYNNVIQNLVGREGILENLRRKAAKRFVLLIFDQENAETPRKRADQIAQDLQWDDLDGFWSSFTFHPVSGWSNLFEHRSDRLHIVLHVSSATINGKLYPDFDGYILQLLQGPAKGDIARALAPSGINPEDLLRKAEQEITTLMERNCYPWTHAKSWLYAYITVFQFRRSHVYFAEEVVQHAPEDELRRVFASLIHAWEILATQ